MEKFIDPKVLDNTMDRYELVTLTLRWARLLKAKGTPESMLELVDKALKEIVEGKANRDDILSHKVVPPPAPVEPAEAAAAAVLTEEEKGAEAPPAKKPKTAKKKKKTE